MKISLNFKLKNLDGKEIEGVEANAGKVIANLLANEVDNPVKFMAWALIFHACKDIQVDKADFDTLKQLIIKTKSITNLVKAQVLEVLSEYKKDK